MTEQPENVSEQIGTDAIGDGGIDDNTGGEVYHGYSVDDEDQPQSTGDSLSDSGRVAEPLDEGYSPPEQRLAGVRSGVRAGSAVRGGRCGGGEVPPWRGRPPRRSPPGETLCHPSDRP